MCANARRLASEILSTCCKASRSLSLMEHERLRSGSSRAKGETQSSSLVMAPKVAPLLLPLLHASGKGLQFRRGVVRTWVRLELLDHYCKRLWQ